MTRKSFWTPTGGGASDLDDLGDVSATSPNDDDILRFNSSTGDWETEALPATSAHDILSSSHSDVDNTDTPVDGDVLTWDDANSQWIAEAPSAGGGGGLTLLDSTVIASSVSEVDFTGLSQDYDDLLVRIIDLVTADASTQDFPQLRLGDTGGFDTGSNYVQGGTYRGTTSGSDNPFFSDSSSFIQTGPVAIGAGASDGNASMLLEFKVRRYTETLYTPVAFEGMFSSVGDRSYVTDGQGLWRDTSAVDRVRIFADGGNLTAGTVEVYGVTE